MLLLTDRETALRERSAAGRRGQLDEAGGKRGPEGAAAGGGGGGCEQGSGGRSRRDQVRAGPLQEAIGEVTKIQLFVIV